MLNQDWVGKRGTMFAKSALVFTGRKDKEGKKKHRKEWKKKKKGKHRAGPEENQGQFATLKLT